MYNLLSLSNSKIYLQIINQLNKYYIIPNTTAPQQTFWFLNIMGNNSNRQDLESLHQKWVTAAEPTSTVFSHINLYRTRLLVNTVTLDYIEQYNLHFTSEEQYKEYLRETEWRQGLEHRDPLAYIPPIRAFINTSTTQLCSRSYTASIYFDKMEMRLQEINDIPINDAAYMLRICLQGFKLLMEHFGVFKITQEMVFINGDGEVRVWIHPDLSSIKPNQGDLDQFINIRQYNSNGTTKQRREGSAKYNKPARNGKTSNNSSMNRKSEQQSIYSHNSHNSHHTYSQNSVKGQDTNSQLSEQNMVKDIMIIIEQNLDIDEIKQKQGKKFKLFSQFVKDYYTNFNNPLVNNSPTVNYQSRFNNYISPSQNKQAASSNKPYVNHRIIYRFNNILDLYNKYIQQYSISVPRRMQVIHDIFRNKDQQNLARVSDNDVRREGISNFDQSAVVDMKSIRHTSDNLNIYGKNRGKNISNKKQPMTPNEENKELSSSLRITDAKNNDQYISPYVYHTSRINDQQLHTFKGISQNNLQSQYEKSLNNSKHGIQNNVNPNGSLSFKYKDKAGINNSNGGINLNNGINKGRRLVTQGNTNNSSYYNITNGITTNIITTNSNTLQVQSQPIVIKSSYTSLNNSKNNLQSPPQHIGNNTSTNNHAYSPYSHGHPRMNSVETRTSVNKYNPNASNTGINSNNNSINYVYSTNNQPNNALTTTPTTQNPIKYHSPLSTLLQQQYPNQPHRIVRTNHIQLNANINERNRNNIKFNYLQNGLNSNLKINKVIDTNNIGNNNIATTPNNKIFNDIKYMKTPNKKMQVQQYNGTGSNIGGQYINKPNSVGSMLNNNIQQNLQNNGMNFNNNGRNQHVSLNKATKIQKYIVNTNNYYTSNNNNKANNKDQNTNTNAYGNGKNTGVNMNLRQTQSRNTYNINQNTNTMANKLNNQKGNRINTYNIATNANVNSIGAGRKTQIRNAGGLNRNRKEIQQQNEKQIKYYTSNDSYELDSEIADDLQNICGDHQR